MFVFFSTAHSDEKKLIVKLRKGDKAFGFAPSLFSTFLIQQKSTLLSSSLQLISSDRPCSDLISNETVDYCEEDQDIRAEALSLDLHADEQWSLNDRRYGLGMQEAWELTTGSPEVMIAVLDSGVDYNHLDLDNNLWSNLGEIPDNGMDDDNNGFVDDQRGLNLLTNKGDVYDNNGHGTHVSGVIGAEGDNFLGISGVAKKVTLIPIKILGASGSGSLFDAIRAIDYVIDLKSRYRLNLVAINASWGGAKEYSQALTDAIIRAGNAGITFVAAASNFGEDNDQTPMYPASLNLPNLISVAATDRHGNIADFSSYGYHSIKVAAPGIEIISTYPGNQYQAISGTSMAAPMVSGVVALLAKFRPELNANDRVTMIQGSTRYLPTLDTVVNSAGIVDAFGALTISLADATKRVQEMEIAASESAPSINIQMNSTKLRGGKRYKVLLSGGNNNEYGNLNINFGSAQCSLALYKMANNTAQLTFKLPRKTPLGSGSIEAHAIGGKIRGSLDLNIKAMAGQQKQRSVTSISSKVFRNWCEAVANSARQEG